MKFFNREKEIHRILSIIKGEPRLIHFIYGPLNSGKSTLMREIIANRLDKSKYIPFFIDFRTRNILNVDNFIECLFEVDEKSKVDDFREYAKSLADLLVKGSEEVSSYYLGMPIKIPKPFFEKIFNKKDKSGDVYQYVEYLFAKLNEKGKIPILIFDELQMIREVTLNGNRLLLWSLFQFLVSLTKVQHLCHVFCLSLDSLFIEYVYNIGELENRADYILVDDFDKQTAIEFIDFLANKDNINLSNRDKELIYSYVGGKPILIEVVIDRLRYEGNLNNILELMLNEEIQKLKYFLEDVEEEDKELYKKVVDALKLFKENYEIEDIAINKKIREFLIKKNILFLNPQKGTLKPQSYLVWNAIKRLL
jgi:AAA+ ATPase superfamily predicted ATPase